MQNQLIEMNYNCSICICTYQMGDTIERCIDSLLENYPPQLIQAYLNGNFTNLPTGAVYSRFDRNQHLINNIQ